MSVGLTMSCKIKAPQSANEQSSMTNINTMDSNPSPYGACEEFATDNDIFYFSYDSSNECFVACTDESYECYDVYDECIAWDNTDECTSFELEVTPQPFRNGCTKLVKENDSFVDPIFECYEWN